MPKDSSTKLYYSGSDKGKMLVTQLCLTLCDPMNPPGPSVHGILQARILEWVAIAISSSRGCSRFRDRTHVSCVSYIGRQILYH